MNKYQTVALNTVYVLFGTVGSKLIFFFLLPLYTRWLGTEEYGATDAITVYTSVLSSIVFLNIADAIFVCPKLAMSVLSKRAYFSSGLCFIAVMAIVGGVLLWLWDVCCPHSAGEMVLYKYKWQIWGVMASSYLQSFIQGFARSLDQLKVYSISGVILAVSVAGLSFLLVPRWGIFGYVYALTMAQLITALYTATVIRASHFFSLKSIRGNALKDMLSYSVPLIPNSMMWWLINGFNRPLMEQQLGLASIGIYAVASRVSGVINSLSSVFGLAWGNSALSEYGKEGFDRFFNNYMKMVVTLYFLSCMCLVIFARDIVRLFTTPAYYEASNYIPILSLGLIFSGISITIGGIFSAVKKSKYFFYASLWGGLASVGSLILLMPHFGLYGVAVSLAISFFVIMVVRWYLASRYVNFQHFLYYLFLIVAFLVVYANTVFVDSYLKYVVDLAVFGWIVLTVRDDLNKFVVVLFNRES